MTTFAVIAGAEPARALRLVGLPLGAWMVATPWFIGRESFAAAAIQAALGLFIAVVSVPRGRVEDRYGGWDRWIV